LISVDWRIILKLMLRNWVGEGRGAKQIDSEHSPTDRNRLAQSTVRRLEINWLRAQSDG